MKSETKLDENFVGFFMCCNKPKAENLVPGTEIRLGMEDYIVTMRQMAFQIARTRNDDDLAEDLGLSSEKESHLRHYETQFKILYNTMLSMWRLRMIEDRTTIEVDPTIQTNFATKEEKEEDNGTVDT